MECQEYSKGSVSSLICSIFSLGKITSESIISFEQRITFLASEYLVQNFFITLESCYLEYLDKLRLLQNVYNKETKITLITHFPEETDWANAISVENFPPCSNIENIDTKAKDIRTQNIRVIKMLIERSDFCICNLDETIFYGRIRKYVRQSKKAKILDLGRPYRKPIFSMAEL